MYINKITGEGIDDNSVVEVTNDGLVLFENGCWKLLAKGQYESSTSNNQEDLYTPTAATGNTANTILSPEKVTNKTMRYYTYYFGLNDLKLANRQYSTTSAILSKDFSVLLTKNVKLQATYTMPKYTSIEFSIIDGIKEAPILPQGMNKITDEKVFFQLPLRFNGSDFKYYKDFKFVGSDKDSAAIKNDSSIYTVSYKPADNAYEYRPEHNTVKIKVLFRMYKDNVQAPQVSNLFLFQ